MEQHIDILQRRLELRCILALTNKGKKKKKRKRKYRHATILGDIHKVGVRFLRTVHSDDN